MYNDTRANAVLAGLRRMALDSRERTQSPTAHKVAGAIYAYLGPRLAADAEMPNVGEMTAGLDRHNLRARRKMVADRVRMAMRGRLGARDDIDDLEQLLEALEEDLGEEHDESYDHVIEAEPGRGGDPEDVDRDPFPEARDRRRAARDEPEPFPGRPRPGGRMDPMSDRNDTRFPEHAPPIDARDRLPHHRRAADFTRPRRLGADSLPTTGSFARRFPFAVDHTEGDEATARFMRIE